MYLEIIFNVLGGLGIFLYGMDHMSSGMQKLAGRKLKKFLAALTTNRVVAILVGIVITMLVQSSSVSTIMTIGFVNASLLTLKQALGVIFGANIGTTVTGWILALNVGKYGLPIVGAGAIAHMFLKSDKAKTRALTVMGLGMIFLGLELMSNGLKPVRTMPEFVRMFAMFSANSYFGVIKVAAIGALITAVVQSSSATLGITITLAVQGLIDYRTAVALVLGENVGTTITAILATLNANVNAKRAAYAHTIINLIGVVWVTALFPFFLKFLSYVSDPEKNMTVAIATAHTTFNVANVLLFTPFIGYLSDFLCRFVKDDGKINNRVTKIDRLMLQNSNIVVEQTRVEILTMGKMIQNMFDEISVAYKNSLELTDEKVKEMSKIEEEIDLYQKEITDANFYILNNKDINESLRIDIRNNLLTSDEYETVSDYLMRITNSLKKLHDKEIPLTEQELNVILKLHDKTNLFFRKIDAGFQNRNSARIKESLIIGKEITSLYKSAKESSIDFGTRADATTLSTTNYTDIINFYRRVSDHLINVIEGYADRNGKLRIE
ncbi:MULTISPECIES: Na/Pi cotransporter family protein [Fusobacterium]|uniref:Na/Pi cotransporter family protein n=1 Tax=Fusobacterium hominis TaxID=2764326 RepID=A0A7G9GX76_9FUSO|nr:MULTISPECIES: Na/Pi cotransporter family protein [Fusobacterium]QNM15408.1 Na/Pi cotransporter family protein [Fusobacterium hominis]